MPIYKEIDIHQLKELQRNPYKKKWNGLFWCYDTTFIPRYIIIDNRDQFAFTYSYYSWKETFRKLMEMEGHTW